MALSGKKIILGVTGGIAAYKSAELASRLVKSGADVQVIMSQAARKFVGSATFQALTRHSVYDSVIIDEKEGQIAHIDLADQADLVLIAPATANTIGRLAAGLSDDMLTCVTLATKAPVWVAPAMNVNMYGHPAVQKNLKTLAEFGYRIIGPDSGQLACGWTGKGRLVDPEEISRQLETFFSAGSGQLLKGRQILVTAGPTRENLDPVRFFSNRSSGKMGYAIAEAAKCAGAEVTLVTGPTAIPAPKGLHVIPVLSASDMYQAVISHYEHMDAVIKAAAVADYRPDQVSDEKIKKGTGPFIVKLVRNPDILMELGRRKKQQVLVGFAAETDGLEEHAVEKLNKKNLDLLVGNYASDSFGKETNRVTLFFASGEREELGTLPKAEVAEKICEAVAGMLHSGADVDR
ncbi:bifunctional phosphopantothenoylcysteine decarboxylase/phosphopantothenate--cysteine ligase CoaBC [Sporolactobacillus sp. THM19-2]|jgi:phosphopantothenoylcysteine decarboxylase/phosphopantothenate--cysteine ligase|uniref:bifunctional phosphopantothenoylcysteine decarboxylase/phosphopantothenate--cysteine ligase CoaBC n=1 Tax=Sporolactobacillus sp. THM19-2 TaxID=2511171 RepID=UPI00101F7F5D|nr:bifunctional phosphopantothenoylcysteine decarboxylase/phosphopantothenate--cysteine ligase CoaBC [Sporolactobacillus sp. THM19-2]RYL92908.1 bifunctional phosphopantothenoylcysteine decarboxylase/phosphopantothenate--cysteine ligase CoaBC [Sporolactobacillus sp. THM19-2]